MDSVPIDELDTGHSGALYSLNQDTDHVQYVTVREESAWEVEADGEWMRRWRTGELDDDSTDFAFAYAELSQTVHRWLYDLWPSAKNTKSMLAFYETIGISFNIIDSLNQCQHRPLTVHYS